MNLDNPECIGILLFTGTPLYIQKVGGIYSLIAKGTTRGFYHNTDLKNLLNEVSTCGEVHVFDSPEELMTWVNDKHEEAGECNAII